jgi:glycosyltransferase involved in cell wall biosynthesis
VAQFVVLSSAMALLAPSPLASSSLTNPLKRDILVVTRLFLPDPGGIQEYVYNRCLHGQDRVILLTSQVPGDRPFDAEQPFPTYRWPVIDLSSTLGMFWVVWQQLLNMIAEVYYGWKLYRKYRFRHIEWTHGYDFPAILLLSYLLPINYYIYLHGDDVLCPLRNRGLRWLFNLTLQRATAIGCNSSFTRDFVQRHFAFDTPTHVIHPSVRPEKFHPEVANSMVSKLGNYATPQKPGHPSQSKDLRTQLNIAENRVILLSVGRLVRRKGFQRVIEQLPALATKGLKIHYVICGIGPMERELRQLAQALGVSHQVTFAGYVPDHKLANFYDSADLFVLPTFYDDDAKSIEGFGIVYVEASYFGKPVVASRIGGVVDAVQHEKTGLLVTPNDPTELFQALYRLCCDLPLRQYLGRQGQKFARRQPHYDKLYEDLAENFGNVTSERESNVPPLASAARR